MGLRSFTGNAVLGAVVVVVALGAAILFPYAAVAEWRATIHAQGAPRIHGTVTNVRPSDRWHTCSGDFVSDDGTVQESQVTVEQFCRGHSTGKGSLVRAFHVPNVDGINSTDTVYLDGQKTYSLGEAYTLCAILTACSLIADLPVIILALVLLSRLGKRRSRPKGALEA